MTWWVLTYLSNTRARTSLFTQAHTNLADHLFMAWATWQPARTPVYRTVRGKRIFCGYKYTWDTPNIVEQSQSANTIQHTFGPFSLQPTDHVWYYLFSITGPYQQPCQGPLIHVLPWETTMPSCRLTNSINLHIPSGALTTLNFDTARWDDGNFYDPGQPSILQAPISGLYHMGASITFDTMINVGIRMLIQFNGGPYLVRHGHIIGPNGWEGTGLSFHTIWPLAQDDTIQLRVYHNRGIDAFIISEHVYSPEFWINYIGPNPL